MNRREFLLAAGVTGLAALAGTAPSLAAELPELVPGKAANVWVKHHPAGPWTQAHRADCHQPVYAQVRRYELGN